MNNNFDFDKEYNKKPVDKKDINIKDINIKKDDIKKNVNTKNDNVEDFSMNLSNEEIKKLSELVKSSLLDELLEISNEELEEYESGFEEKKESTFKKHYFDVEKNFYEHNSLKECAVCGSKIKDFGHYSVEFGENIRKKANFCGLDCLSEFIEELKYTKGLKEKNDKF